MFIHTDVCTQDILTPLYALFKSGMIFMKNLKNFDK